MKSSYSLGLDISTSCTGLAALDAAGDVIAFSYCKPAGDTLVAKADMLGCFIKEWCDHQTTGPLKAVYIEQNLQRFRRGFSSAQVINTLARFNGMISYIVYRDLGIQPVYVNVNEGRKSLGIKIARGSNTKEEILKWCSLQYPDISWPEKKLKSGPRKGLVIQDDCCYDIADAIVTAKAGLTIYDNV